MFHYPEFHQIVHLFKEGNPIKKRQLIGKLKNGYSITTIDKLLEKNFELPQYQMKYKHFLVYKDYDNHEKAEPIDEELTYIKKASFELYIPQNQLVYVDKLILAALKLIDTIYHNEGWLYNFCLYGPSKLIYQLYNFDKVTPQQKDYIRQLFEYNPIKIRLYVAQVHYFIKKYIENHIILSRSPIVHFNNKDYIQILKEQLNDFKDDEDLDLIGEQAFYYENSL